MPLTEEVAKELVTEGIGKLPRLFRWVVGLPDRLKWIPLSDAALRVYEESRARGALISGAAERLSLDKTPDGVLSYVATYIAQDTAIWGTRPPSRQREPIGMMQAKNGKFLSAGRVMQMSNGVEYRDLRITRVDQRRLLKELRAEAERERNRNTR